MHRSDDSGTTKNFADYLNQVAPEVWDQKPADPFPYQTGEGAQGTSGVIDAVTNGTNTIGYADASRAGDLGVVKIKVGDEFVAPSAEGAAAVVAESPAVEGREANDLAVELDRTTTDPSHYPLVLVSYAIVCHEYADAAQGELVKAYVGYMARRRPAGRRRGRRLRSAAPTSCRRRSPTPWHRSSNNEYPACPARHPPHCGRMTGVGQTGVRGIDPRTDTHSPTHSQGTRQP